eukprot:SAG31_NODE_31038_length_373_cov_0.740876_1_plen_106_part_10
MQDRHAWQARPKLALAFCFIFHNELTFTVAHLFRPHIGSGYVGKTSLIKRLREQAFDPAEPSTRGIEAYHVEALSWRPRGGAEQGEADVLGSAVAKELRKVENEKA